MNDENSALDFLSRFICESFENLEVNLRKDSRKVAGFELSVEAATPESSQNESELEHLLDQESAIETVINQEVNEKEVVELSDDESTEEAVLQNESNVLVAKQNNVATTSKRICRVETSKREHETNDSEKKLDDVVDSRAEQISVALASSRRKKSSRAEKTETVYPVKGIPIRREDLLECKHTKRQEAARSLGIGLASLQDACRHFGYGSWPLGETDDNASSTCNVKNVNEEEEEVTEKRKKVNNDNPSSSSACDTKHVKGEKVPKKRKKVSTLCSNPPPMHAIVATVSVHPIPDVSPQNDAGTVTTYLRYRGDTFRFQLQFSSTVPNLRKKGKRFSLDEGSFDIKYQDDKNKLISIAVDEGLGNSLLF